MEPTQDNLPVPEPPAIQDDRGMGNPAARPADDKDDKQIGFLPDDEQVGKQMAEQKQAQEEMKTKATELGQTLSTDTVAHTEGVAAGGAVVDPERVAASMKERAVQLGVIPPDADEVAMYAEPLQELNTLIETATAFEPVQPMQQIVRDSNIAAAPAPTFKTPAKPPAKPTPPATTRR